MRRLDPTSQGVRKNESQPSILTYEHLIIEEAYRMASTSLDRLSSFRTGKYVRVTAEAI